MLDICCPLPAAQQTAWICVQYQEYTLTNYLKSEGGIVFVVIKVAYHSVASQRNGACGSTVLQHVNAITTFPGRQTGSQPEETCGRTISLPLAQTSVCARCGYDLPSCSASLTCGPVVNPERDWPYKAILPMAQNARNESLRATLFNCKGGIGRVLKRR